MKIRIGLLLTGLTTILILSGCAEVGPVPSQTNQPNGGNRIISTQALQNRSSQEFATRKDRNLSQQEQQPPITIETMEAFQSARQGLGATDQAAFDAALKLGDPSYCDKMSTDQYKEQCQTALKDKANLEEAMAKTDVSLCDKMSSTDLREACKIQIDVIVKEAQNKQQFEDQMAISKEITATKDYTRCSKELKDPSIIDSCELTIIMNLALESNDVTLCEKITSSEAEQRCKEDFAKLSAPPPGN